MTISLGGATIQQECDHFIRTNGDLMEGQVFVSSAGNLRCKKIIHAVGPKWNGGNAQEERTLYTCIDNCFDEVQKINNSHSIAIPPISTGIFGYPLGKAVATIVEVVYDRGRSGGFLPRRIIFVDNKDDSLRLFEKEIRTKFVSKPMVPLGPPGQAAKPG